MVLAFEPLKNHSFELSNIQAMYRKPSWRFLKIEKRTKNGFLYITRGKCVYRFQDGEFTLGPGSVVYLPFESKHELTIYSEEFEFYCIDFTVKMQGEIVCFSQMPLKMTDSAPKEFAQAICALEEDYRLESNMVVQTELICKAFRALQTAAFSAQAERLAPAIRYLHEHVTDSVVFYIVSYHSDSPLYFFILPHG